MEVNRLVPPTTFSPNSPHGKVVLFSPRAGPNTKILSNVCLWAKKSVEASGGVRAGIHARAYSFVC